MTRWYEDILENEVFDIGSHTFNEAEIIRFASAYDPQYFHSSPELAAHSQFNGLVATGWHTVCVGQRKMVDAIFAEEARLRDLGEEPGITGPSPGINKMVFKAPVRPGDTVDYTMTVVRKRPSNSLPGWGILFNHVEGMNQKGEMVYHAELVSFSKLRDFKPSLGMRFAIWASTVPGLKNLVQR